MNENTEKAPEVETEEQKLEKRMTQARTLNPNRHLVICDSPAGTLILGTPKQADCTAYLALVHGEPSEKAVARKSLFLACAVDPSQNEMQSTLSQYPLIFMYPSVQSAIDKCTGVAKDDASKK